MLCAARQAKQDVFPHVRLGTASAPADQIDAKLMRLIRLKARKRLAANESSPLSGVSTPAIIFISVDFPAPLPPISA
jgi:hypothetical protein